LKNDFKIFENTKRILNNIGLSGKLKEKIAIQAIADPHSSYIKKFFLLSHSLNLIGIMPGVMSPLLKVCSTWPHDSFETNIQKILRTNTIPKEASKIEEIAFYLYNQVLLSKDHIQPRTKVSSFIIPKVNAQSENNIDSITLTDLKISNNDTKQFEEWLESWQFSHQALKSRVRSLLITLLMSQKNDDNTINLTPPFSVIPIEADKLNLDHLEPSNPNRSASNAFFESTERHRLVNSLGNMMILDFPANIRKSNNPMEKCFDVLKDSNLENHWLTLEIKNILDENNTEVENKKVPNENFFIKRAQRLRKIMKTVLIRDYGVNTISPDSL
jgi:hypothetical protein